MKMDFNNTVLSRLGFHSEDHLNSTVDGQTATILTEVNVVLLFTIFLFIAHIKDVKIEGERIPLLIPTRPPRGFRFYAVILETGGTAAGGTTSNVTLQICGSNTTSPPFMLSSAGKNWRLKRKKLFQSQSKDLFILSLPHYLGNVKSFEVHTDRTGDCPAWFLKKIRCMCLDNKKCWKSDVKAWLKGDDTKVHRLPATAVAPFATRQYITKVFLQNYNWIFVWSRSLGSPFKCKQRWAVFWSSICVSTVLCHFMLYDHGLVKNVLNKRIDVPVFTSNDMIVASFISSAVGVLFGMVLRTIVKKLAGGKLIERFNDKDDFSYLFKGLTCEDGEVVSIPLPKTTAIPGSSKANFHDKESPKMKNVDQELEDAVKKLGGDAKLKASTTSANDDTGLSINAQMDQLSSAIANLISKIGGQFNLPAQTNSKAEGSKLKNDLSRATSKSTLGLNTEYYDSLSEAEGDEPFVTWIASERKPVRRNFKMYNSAPVWEGSRQVWVENSHGGRLHHTRLNQRYAKTELTGTGDRDEAIQTYWHDEQNAQLGRVRSSHIIATLFACTTALLSTAALAFCIFQRIYLPNADSVIFFYAVSLLLLFHALVFSVLEGLFCGFSSVWIRRRRMFAERKVKVNAT